MERVDHLHAWATARAVGNLLDARGATWAIVGGIAANVYRHDVRATGDVDLLVSFAPFDSATALATLGEELERPSPTDSVHRTNTGRDKPVPYAPATVQTRRGDPCGRPPSGSRWVDEFNALIDRDTFNTAGPSSWTGPCDLNGGD